jgi:DNA-directed RNA polymerase specialized sigma24 family protein
VQAWQAADRFGDNLGSLRTWLFAIIRNVVIDLLAGRAVRPMLAVAGTADDVIDLTDDEVDRAQRVADRRGAAHGEQGAPAGPRRGPPRPHTASRGG